MQIERARERAGKSIKRASDHFDKQYSLNLSKPNIHSVFGLANMSKQHNLPKRYFFNFKNKKVCLFLNNRLYLLLCRRFIVVPKIFNFISVYIVAVS